MKLSPRFAVSILLVLLFVAGLPVWAQSVAAQVNDVATHKFRPPVALSQPGAGVASQALSPVIAETAKRQLQALLQEKNTRTPAQQKISSQLLYTARMLRSQVVADGVQYLETGVDLDDNNNMLVDIAAHVNDDLLRRLTENGCRVIDSHAAGHWVRAIVPPDQLEDIAGRSDVIRIRPRQKASLTGGLTSPGQPFGSWRMAAGFAQRAANINASLAAYLAPGSLFAPYSSFDLAVAAGVPAPPTSEGDLTHRALDARNQFGISGAGLKIGVLSDGVTHLADSQAAGALGMVVVLPGQAGDGDEGTAMLELIHTLVPGAQLYFATAFTSITSFGDNIRALRAAGCDIIVDDVFYYVETPFQDGQAPSVVSDSNGGYVIQAVNDVVADGAMYFSSAGNSGNVTDGTAGNYEGDFTDGGAISLLPGGTVHMFGSTQYDQITKAGDVIMLYWSDPLGNSTNDYDLFVLNSTSSAIVAASTDWQHGVGDDPLEGVDSPADLEGNRIVVFKANGAAPRYIHVDNTSGHLAIVTPGTTHGHLAARKALSIAATPAAQAFYPGYPDGPYPGPFSGTNAVEGFSSDGPRRIFFNADSTPITSGNFSSTGGELLNKPDYTAADGVSVTGVGGFGSPFYGTSAAAPHAAAVAALAKAANPGRTPAEIQTTLTNTAVDIMSPGWDRNSGAGIVMAWEAINSLGVSGLADPDLKTVTASENPGNGDGYIEAGEGAKIIVELKNAWGVVEATNITATLTTSTLGISIARPATVTYPNLAPLTGTGVGSSPFFITVAPTVPCGAQAIFTLTLTYTGGPSPRALTFAVPITVPPVVINSVLDATAPAAVPNVTTATGTQTGRLYRSGTGAACGTAKPWPGYGATTGERQYDSYTFTACQSVCGEVTLSGPNSINMLSAMYRGAFDPANISNNFVGDTGWSAVYPLTYGTLLTGGTSYTVVVHEVPVGGAVGSAYTLALPACAINCPAINQPPVAAAHDVTVQAGPSGTAAVSVNNGSSDPEGGPLAITQIPAGPYPLGVSNVILNVADNKGAITQAEATVTVTAIPVTATISAPGAVVLGATVTFTATLSSGSGTPTGNVTFMEGSTTLGTGAVNGSGVATFSTNSLAPGSHSVTAVYRGNLGFAGSTSSAVTVNVVEAATPIVTGASPAVKAAGSAAFTVSVTGNNFLIGATVNWNGSARTTTWVSATQLKADINAADVATVGKADVTVTNPAGASPLSAAFKVAIDTAAGTAGAVTASAGATLAVTHGSTATLTITYSGANSSSVTTAECLNLPAGATCTYDDTAKKLTVTAASGTAPGMYNIIVVFQTTQRLTAVLMRSPAIFAAWSGLLGLPLGLFWMGGGRRKVWTRVAVALFALLLIAFLAGCGGGSRSSAPAATSVSSQSSVPVGLTVN